MFNVLSILQRYQSGNKTREASAVTLLLYYILKSVLFVVEVEVNLLKSIYLQASDLASKPGLKWKDDDAHIRSDSGF